MKKTIEVDIDEKEVLSELRSWFDSRINMKMVQEIVLQDKRAVLEIAEAGMDTVCRDMCVDVLSHKFVGKCWPMNGDSEEYKESFHKKWNEEIEKYLTSTEGKVPCG